VTGAQLTDVSGQRESLTAFKLNTKTVNTKMLGALKLDLITKILQYLNLDIDELEEGQPRTTMYTQSQIDTIHAARRELTNYSDNYNGTPNKFMDITASNAHLGSYHCRESMASVIRRDLNAGTCVWRLGITQLAESKKQALIVSNRLHTLEAELGFKFHTLKCLSVKGATTHIVWVFRLDPKWYNCPPVLSYLMHVLRSGFRQGNYSRVNAVYTLLQKRAPHKVFGPNRKRNWGIFKPLEKRTNTAVFSGRYGMVGFHHDVVTKNETTLKAKFPGHKIFDELPPQ
jgi:hypothetical protein